MKYLDLLDMSLKDDALCDLFDTYDVNVIYEYDRIHEGMPDQYHAEIPDLGLEFNFDENQRFSTLFYKPKDVTTFNPFDPNDDTLQTFPSKPAAIRYAEAKGIGFNAGKADLFGTTRDFVRFNFGPYSIHYEYVDDALRTITLQRVDSEDTD